MKLLTALLLWLAVPLAHAVPVPLTIGGTTIQFPIDPDYVQVSQQAPQVFSVTEAGLPASNRLVEIFESSTDLARTRAGGVTQDLFYQVQVVRSIESRQISIDDWNELNPQLTAGMASLDVDSAIASGQAERNARMSSAAGRPVGMTFGKVGQPVIYRQTPMSVAFTMMVPVQANIGGVTQSQTIAAACAMLVVRNKLINVYAYSMATDDTALANLRARLDSTVDQTITLNPSDSSVVSTGAFDWSHVGRTAFIGALIGGCIGLFRMIFKRKDG